MVFDGVYSTARDINLPTVQGSVTGPCLYIITDGDLNQLSRSNIPIKFADSTNLLVHERTESTSTEEFAQICDC